MIYVIIAITTVVSFVCFYNRDLFEELGLIPHVVVKNNQWYRLITYGFVHANAIHLLINMFTFWSFGTYLEGLFAHIGFGRVSFLILYFGGMTIASLHDIIKQNDDPDFISIGASGAISAVLFCSIFLEPWGKVLLFAAIPVPGIIFGILYLVYCQYITRREKDETSHNAHFYGAVFGFIFPLILRPSLMEVFLSNFR